MWSSACACGSAESDTVCPVWNVDMRALKIAGAAVAAVVVIVAALNLVLDFDFIESGASSGAPK